MVRTQSPPETVSELVKEVSEDVRQLVADEVALAKAELKATAFRGLRLAAGAVLALVGLAVMALFALITLVEWRPNHALVAGLIAAVGLLLAFGGGLVIWLNRRLLPLPETRASLVEDLDWLRGLSRRGRR
ncbi:MAG: phage holin family protein [Candidatus Dormibacteria bacterium]